MPGVTEKPSTLDTNLTMIFRIIYVVAGNAGAIDLIGNRIKTSLTEQSPSVDMPLLHLWEVLLMQEVSSKMGTVITDLPEGPDLKAIGFWAAEDSATEDVLTREAVVRWGSVERFYLGNERNER